MATHKASAKAREADKLRKRAKRAKARLEKDLASGKIKAGSEKAKTAQRLVGSLEKTISQSYADKGGKRQYSEKAQKAIAKGAETAERLKGTKGKDLTARRNRMMETKLNNAGKTDAFSSISHAEAQMFYRATQELWQGLPASEYNNAIVQKLGAADLQEAYNMIMNRDDVKAALRNEGVDVEGYTDENESFYRDEDLEDRDKKSPTFVAQFTPIHFG